MRGTNCGRQEGNAGSGQPRARVRPLRKSPHALRVSRNGNDGKYVVLTPVPNRVKISCIVVVAAQGAASPFAISVY